MYIICCIFLVLGYVFLISVTAVASIPATAVNNPTIISSPDSTVEFNTFLAIDVFG